MFGLFKSTKPKRVFIEGMDRPIEVGNKETLLNAALRQGVPFPHSCRVGGCATCKCRLTEGKVRELTESAYVLSEQELDQGYILACQSVPKTDIHIAVDHLDNTYQGKVMAQQALTHDIMALDIRLQAPMQYIAGQYALLSVPGLIDEPRSYSFATPAQTGAAQTLRFFIRQVTGGQMSTWAQGQVVDTEVQLQGPFGDFYLRPGERNQPILCIAGGSGLAPIKALLEAALSAGNTQPVTFLFGARRQQDLYCLDAIEQLQQQWPGEFTFIPVLSEAADDAHWTGARGLVTEHLAQHCSPDCQAYLCGPPAMLDAAENQLQQLGVSTEHIFSDKFLDKSSQPKIA